MIVHGDLCSGGPHTIGSIVLPLHIQSVSGAEGGLNGTSGPRSRPSVAHVSSGEGNGWLYGVTGV